MGLRRLRKSLIYGNRRGCRRARESIGPASSLFSTVRAAGAFGCAMRACIRYTHIYIGTLSLSLSLSLSLCTFGCAMRKSIRYVALGISKDRLGETGSNKEEESDAEYEQPEEASLLQRNRSQVLTTTTMLNCVFV